MDINNFQRLGSTSNTQVGRDFEVAVQNWFLAQGVELARNYSIPVGFQATKKHRFDLGSPDPALLVECKSFTWTSGNNTPIAKMYAVNEVMLHFAVAPKEYRKVLVMLKHVCSRRNVSLASHYARTYEHLIPPGVEIWEFCTDESVAVRIK